MKPASLFVSAMTIAGALLAVSACGGGNSGPAPVAISSPPLPTPTPAAHRLYVDHNGTLYEYALPLARKLGFRHALATRRLFGTDAKEKIGEEKCRRTLEYIQAQGWGERKRVFFTDHADDAAMIAQSHIVAWFGDEAEAVRLQLHWPQIAITPMLERDGNELLDWVAGVMADRV